MVFKLDETVDSAAANTPDIKSPGKPGTDCPTSETNSDIIY